MGRRRYTKPHAGTRVLALRQATVLLRTRRLPSGTGRAWSSGARNAEWGDNVFVGTAMAAEAYLYRHVGFIMTTDGRAVATTLFA